MEEIWKEFYDEHNNIKLFVSTFGNVKSVDKVVSFSDNKPDRLYKSKLLKVVKDKYGYMRLSAGNAGIKVTYKVHRLVAITHLGIPEDTNKNQVNHIDGNKSNNHVNNLEWCSNSYTQKHAIDSQLKGVYFGTRSIRGQYTTFAINLATNEITAIMVGNSDMNFNGFDHRLVFKVVNGERPHHKWYYFVRIPFSID